MYRLEIQIPVYMNNEGRMRVILMDHLLQTTFLICVGTELLIHSRPFTYCFFLEHFDFGFSESLFGL